MGKWRIMINDIADASFVTLWCYANATWVLQELYVQFKLLMLQSATGGLWGFPQWDDYKHE